MIELVQSSATLLGPSAVSEMMSVVVRVLALCALVLVAAAEQTTHVTSVVRHHDGDYYTLRDSSSPPSCRCLEGGATPMTPTGSSSSWPSDGGPADSCRCHCPRHRPLLRDDKLSCEAGVAECLLAEFVGPEGAESVPHVYLPVKGQLVNPKAEVALMGLKSPGGALVSPVCVVTEAQKLTPSGWRHLPNATNFEPPFRLHRDKGRTFLRWVGDTATRLQVEGHLVLVSLLCRDTANADMPHFTPCVAFRAAGSFNLTPDEQSGGGHELAGGGALRSWLIGGAVAAGAVMLYLAIVVCLIQRRRRRRTPRRTRKESNLEQGILSTTSSSKGSSSHDHASQKPRQTQIKQKKEQQHKHQLQQEQEQQNQQMHGSLLSESDVLQQEPVEDLSGRRSSCRRQRQQALNTGSACVLVHETQAPDVTETPAQEKNDTASPSAPQLPFFLDRDAGGSPAWIGNNNPRTLSPSHPEPEYSDAEEALQPEQGPNARKKLYFNPSYFEPEMLQEPPPAALDFLDKIREIISSAKSKMRNRTFQPSLNDIPEDDYTYHSQSRPHSRSTAAATPSGRSKVSFRMAFSSKDEVEDLTNSSPLEYENVVSSDPQESGRHDESFAEDSLDGGSDAASRASTLKRIAKRVNERGTSLVSEIIKTLDKKNRDTSSNLSYSSSKFRPKRDSQNKVDQLVKVHSFSNNRQSYAQSSELCINAINTGNSDDRHPDLIKPSILRSILKDGKQKSDEGPNTFENFCQEMIATFNRIKRYGDARTPVSTIGKKKKRSPTQPEPNFPKESENGDGKVRQWLEGLDREGLYAGDSIGIEQVIPPVKDSTLATNVSSVDSSECRETPDGTATIKPDVPKRAMNLNISNDEMKILSPNFSGSGIFSTKAATCEVQRNSLENTYEEIKTPQQGSSKRMEDGNMDLPITTNVHNIHGSDDDSCSYSDEDSLDSQVMVTKKLDRTNDCSQEITKTIKGAVNNCTHEEDELNTSFDPDTLERQPKRRNVRSRSILREKYSDYCTTDSEEIYDATSAMSVQSIVTSESQAVSRREINSEAPALKTRASFRNDHNVMNGNKLRSLPEPDRPPLPPKLCSSPDRNSVSPPARPPKSGVTPPAQTDSRPPLPVKGTKNRDSNEETSEPPELPQKSKKIINSDWNPDRIPELSDEAAAAILLGLQARTSPLALFSSSADETTVHSGGQNLTDKIQNTNKMFSENSNVRRSLKKKTPSRALPERINLENSSSNGSSEERVRGQFILAPEGKSPLSRRSSLSRSGQGSTSRSSSSDTDISNKNVKLCQCAKTELEKHFIENGKPNADTIKKTWRRVMNKSEESSDNKAINKSHLSNINEEQEASGECKKCTKQKQEDSGYQSSDSCASDKSRTSSYYESSCSIDLECADDTLANGLTVASKRSNFGPQIFPKSQSLQHLQEVPVHDVYGSFEGSRCSSSHSSQSEGSVIAVRTANT